MKLFIGLVSCGLGISSSPAKAIDIAERDNVRANNEINKSFLIINPPVL